MKLATSLSATAHAAILAYALVSLAAPAPLVTIEEQGVAVDFASLEPSAPASGEKKADVDAEPVAAPTQRPQKTPDAQNVGEANEDSPTRKGVVTDKPLDTSKAAPAPKAEKVVAAPTVRPEPVREEQTQATPVTSTQAALENREKVPLTPDPEPEAVPEPEKPVEDTIAKLLEDKPEPTPEPKPEEPKAQVPDKPAEKPVETVEKKPEPKPEPKPVKAAKPKPQTAETTERKVAEDSPKREKTAASTETTREVTDKIASLLNRQDDTAGGAKRSTRTAALGDAKPSSGAKLTRGEYDALKGQIAKCWSIPSYVDQENLKVTVLMGMTRDGQLEQISDITVDGVAQPAHVRAVQSSLKRSLDARNCDLAGVLPADKYDTWREVKVNFTPQDF